MAAKPKLQAVPAPREKIVVSWADMREVPLSGREIRDFERAQPVTFMRLQRETGEGGSVDLPWDTLLALLWILHRRSDSTFTFEQALDLRIDEWEFSDIAISDVADPTQEPVAIATGS